MGNEEVLIARKAALVAAASVFVCAGARAADKPPTEPASAPATSILEPERITAGSSDQFLAVLDPAGERMIWVSNENATNELFGLDFASRAPQRLFDEAADVTIPRVSPDGNKLLYLSFRSAATGELCVREWKKSSLELSERKCLSTGGRNVMQALWEPDSKSALVVSRDGLNGEIDLRRFAVDGSAGASGGDAGELIVKRDLSSPALSPDGKWLLYVPVRRTGPAAAPAPDTAKGEMTNPSASATPLRQNRLLGLIHLGGPGAPADAPRDISFPLPGLPGFPAFSPDGHFVYFVQYLNDTNLDGVVDANDRAVLFRAPFDSTAEEPLDTAHAQQLTSADWDCQYPFPGKERLIATCLSQGSLDIYSFPLEGVIPPSWKREQLLQELATNRSPWQRLHLFTRLLELDQTDGDRAFHLKRIIELHLSMREYQSATFYAGQLERLAAGKQGVEPWPEEQGIGQVMHELARHRRSLANLSEGQATQAVEDAMRERVTKLQPFIRSRLPAVAELGALVESEIDDALGDKALALERLEQVRARIHADVGKTRPIVLHLYGQRARSLFESLNEREQLLQVDLLLSQHPQLDAAEQVSYAADYLQDLLRGRAREEQKQLLAEAAKKLQPGSNAAFVVELEEALQPLGRENQLEIEKKIFALMDKNTAYERGRMIVHETVARARSSNSEVLWYDVAERWASAVSPQNTDRKRTEAIFKRVATERAYIEWARGDLAEAEQHFAAVTQHTSSLEAYAGDIDIQLLSGERPAKIEQELRARFAATPDAPELLFSLSYLEARGLPAEPDARALAKKAEEAKGRLRRALLSLPNSIPIHYLWAYLRHEEYLRSGDSATALRANAHYQIVVDLAKDEPRYRAAALAALGFLHARLGNHAMANSFFEEREKLPFASAISQLAVCTQRARSLLHADRGADAAAESDRCVALIDSTPALAKFLPYALDRAALHHLDAGEAQLAQARYDRLEPLLKEAGEDPHTDPIARRNQFVIQLARASAELSLNRAGEALRSLDEADALFHLPKNIETLESIYAAKSSPDAFTQDDLTEDYEALLTGLRARALTAQGKLDEAKAPSERRLQLLQQRAKRDGAKPAAADDQRFIALLDANLAATAYRHADIPGAIARIEAGLAAGDELARRTATPLHHVIVALLAEYAELHFAAHVPLAQLKLDLPGRLAKTYAELVDHPQDRFAQDRAQFAIYLDRLLLEGVPIALP